MRVDLSLSMILKLAAVIPMTLMDGDTLIAVPMVLPMRWMESLPAFGIVIETIVDLANDKIAQGYILALYHCHQAMPNTILDKPIVIECL